MEDLHGSGSIIAASSELIPSIRDTMATAASQMTPGGESRSGNKEKFSTLHLRDKVVTMALFEQIVTETEVASLWQAWRAKHLHFHDEPFWRLLTLLPSTNPELIYEQAARVADIEDAHIASSIAIDMIRKVAAAIPPADWKKWLNIPMVPVTLAGYGQQARALVVATHDPTNPLAKKLVHGLRIPNCELRYASKTSILELLQVAFPSREIELHAPKGSPSSYDHVKSFQRDFDSLLP